jgi:hypothetical protein
MRMALRWTVLVSAVAAGVMLVTSGPAGAAGAARARSSSQAAARTAADGALGNYRITGVEDAIGCLTAHRCEAVGYGGGKAPGQVVTVVGGKQVRVSVVRSASNLVAVSCPSQFGCWAMGPPRNGHRSWVLVKIGPTGSARGVSTVRVPAGVYLDSISCTSRTSCEIFGKFTTTKGDGFSQWYLASWNGRKLSQRYVVGPVGYTDSARGISCWQATCVAVGSTDCGGSACVPQGIIVTTNHGKPGPVETVSGSAEAVTGFDGISCVSSSTCYATAFRTVVTLDDGALGTTQNLPVYAGSSIECAGTTCWAAGISGEPGLGPAPAAFEMITSGVPTETPITDPALGATNAPAIARRGNGFAAVGAALINGGPRVSEVATN